MLNFKNLYFDTLCHFLAFVGQKNQYVDQVKDAESRWVNILKLFNDCFDTAAEMSSFLTVN